jgi:pimeloyl-ACP methyl ester carboxylesterase
MTPIESTADHIGFIANRWPLDKDQATIIFLHGSGGASILWQNQVQGLESVNAIAPDLPGHGRSRGPGRTRVEDYAADISDFQRFLGLSSTVICGLSIGGAIALQLLLDHADQFVAGILINTGAKLKVLPRIFEEIERDFPGFLRFLRGFTASEKTDPSRIQPMIDCMAACPPAVTLGDFAACDRFDVRERLHEIHVPTLVMTASDDRLTPPKFGTFLAEKIPRSHVVNIADAGHLSPLEKPVEVTRAIQEFLDTVPVG